MRYRCSPYKDFPWSRGTKKPGLLFLDASSHLYKRVCPSVGPSVGPLVRPSVRWSVGHAFVKMSKKVERARRRICCTAGYLFLCKYTKNDKSFGFSLHAQLGFKWAIITGEDHDGSQVTVSISGLGPTRELRLFPLNQAES